MSNSVCCWTCGSGILSSMQLEIVWREKNASKTAGWISCRANWGLSENCDKWMQFAWSCLCTLCQWLKVFFEQMTWCNVVWVIFYFPGDVGNYYYGQGHPMKPHRIRMTHNLLLNYGLYRKMEIYVSCTAAHKPPTLSSIQKLFVLLCCHKRKLHHNFQSFDWNHHDLFGTGCRGLYATYFRCRPEVYQVQVLLEA